MCLVLGLEGVWSNEVALVGELPPLLLCLLLPSSGWCNGVTEHDDDCLVAVTLRLPF